MIRVKIVSGWTNPGGSTVHFINLTNLFNNNGIDCTFYGPHTWHLDKCKSGNMGEAAVSQEDILISHFIDVPPSIRWKQHILSCHETEIYPLKGKILSSYDMIHFVSNWQKKWHSVNHPSVIIPPIVEKILWDPPKTNTVGIIGSIDKNKNVHKSIDYAIKDLWDNILIYGIVTDQPYYDEYIKKYVDSGKVIMMGHEDDKTKMYNSVDVIYQSSTLETYGLIEAECTISDIPFVKNGVRQLSNLYILSNEEILDLWIKILEKE